MTYIEVALAASLIINIAVLSFFLFRKKQPKELTTDAKHLLSELTRGNATINIEVLDPDLLFMWKPNA